jgi:hypothetical protein
MWTAGRQKFKATAAHGQQGRLMLIGLPCRGGVSEVTAQGLLSTLSGDFTEAELIQAQLLS